MALEINAQFNKFLQFAELQRNPAKSEAIARITGDEDALAGRTITASTADFVRGVFTWKKRSGTEEARNNETRALFRKAVADMFGGEKNIPESVKTAMRLGDYNHGKPLTARRIIAVQKALRPYIIQDAVNDAADYMNRICRKFEKAYGTVPQTNEQQRREAVRLVKRFGSGLNEWGLRTLANAVVYAMAKGYDPQTEARRVKAMIAPFRDFRPGDKRFAAVDRKLLPYTQAILDSYLSPNSDQHFDEDGLFDNFIKDSDRIGYTINGEQLPRDPKAVQEAFMDKIKNFRHRRALSCFFSQMSMFPMACMSARKNLPDLSEYKGYNVMDQPGAGMFAGLDNSKLNHIADAYMVTDPRIALEISDGGNKVKMTIEAEGLLLFANDSDTQDFCRPIGGFNWKQEIVFDLSGEDAVITDTHIGQDLIANIAPRSNEA